MVVQRKKYNTPPIQWGRGAFVGYDEFRHGAKPSKRPKRPEPRLPTVTMALRLPLGMRNQRFRSPALSEADAAIHWVPRGPFKSRLLPKERKQMETATAALLRPFVTNRWEGEAAAVHGLRLGFVERGFDWHDAEAEAADIVRIAFNRLGRGKETRPTWDEGQAWYGHKRDRCLYCFGEIQPEHLARGWLFCQPECAHKALRLRNWEHGNAQKSKIGQQATKIARLHNIAPRHCKECGGAFIPEGLEQTTCSQECRNARKGRERVREDRNCETCGNVFYPHVG